MTAAILALCAIVFGWEVIVMTAGGQDALEAIVGQWGLVPKDVVAALSAGNLLSLPVLTLFTHMFLHGGWLHLMGNMLFLWIFAVNVEDRLGRILFLLFYLLGGLAAAAGHILVDPASDLPMVGASGAISAVLGAYVVLYPRGRIQSLVFPVFFYELRTVPAFAVLGYWFVLQLIDGLASLRLTAEASGGVALWAHIGGFVAGMVMALPLRYVRRGPAHGPATAAASQAAAGAGPALGPAFVPPPPLVPPPPPPPPSGA